MRAIKFRQPVFLKGKFLHFHYWGIIKEGVFIAPMNQVDTWKDSQQMTGLLDSKGKESYHKDICEYKDDAGINRVGILEWSNCAWWLEAIGGDDEGNQDVMLADVEDGFTVIGSMYENPELTKPT